MSRRRRPRRGPAGSVRIIGGEWRGRRLPVAAGEGLRPTPDRVRETLFNWLGPQVAGARCADLFAGSGVLGFEAASRGAARVVMVERDPALASVLEEARQRLGGSVEVVCADAMDWLAAAVGPFDIIFLDPPYGGDLLAGALRLIAGRGLLAPAGRLYLESGGPLAAAAAGWELVRQGRAGQVHYGLAVRPQP